MGFFTTPVTGTAPGGPSQITEAITTLLRSVAQNANVRIAIYEMHSRSDGRFDQVGAIAKAVRFAAQKRNATVLVVADQKRRIVRVDGRKVDSALVGLDAFHDNITVRWCKAGCISTRTRTPSGGVPLMHNKFMTVDNTVLTPGCCDRVVLQMTSNWTNGQLRDHRWNSAVQVTGNKSLFAGYVKYWKRLWDCAGQGACRPVKSNWMAVEDPRDVRVHVSPRGSGNPDPVLEDLDDLDCGLGPAVGLPVGPTGIDIAMGAWTNPIGRGGQIVDKLAELNADCQIRIVLQADRQPIIDQLQEAGLRPRCSEGASNLKLGLPSVHSKYMLMRGNYQGAPAVAVFTGSANFTKKSLDHNDETWMRFLARPFSHPQNATLYAQYLADFETMWAQTLPCSLVDVPSQ